MRDSARSKNLDAILGINPPLAPPLPQPDPRDVEREEQRDAAMVEVVEQETIEAELARPTLSARRRLRQTVDERGEELVEHAVASALKAKGRHGVASVARLLDVADAPEARIPTSLDEVAMMTYAELRVAVHLLPPETLARLEAGS